ncbi:MAG: ABC transporter permease [Proteobacteria bacterium]|nr:ABC transporter permease [Pseudomonadota bacterium]
MLFKRFIRNITWPAGISLLILLLLYLSALFAPFVSPYDFKEQSRKYPNAPPANIHISPLSEWGKGFFYVHPVKMADVYKRRYEEDKNRKVYIDIITDEGRLFGLSEKEERLFIFGSDTLGRDLFSRTIHGGRVSLTVGILGVLISYSLGLIIGSISGYFGGLADNIIMRLAEVFMSVPSFFLLLALAVVIPSNVSSAMTFLLIVVIMSFIGWAGFARVIRGMVISERERDYVMAAKALGASHRRILFKHVIPSTFNYTIISATLSIPGFILGESALSLLGLGIQEPDASWGNLLASSQNVQNLINYPWILIPGIFIFLTIMSYNFLGDYMRDIMSPRDSGGVE